ncbi:hypothetical protein U1Q18_010233 [Sarracenia purpurea var. burkii]
MGLRLVVESAVVIPTTKDGILGKRGRGSGGGRATAAQAGATAQAEIGGSFSQSIRILVPSPLSFHILIIVHNPLARRRSLVRFPYLPLPLPLPLFIDELVIKMLSMVVEALSLLPPGDLARRSRVKSDSGSLFESSDVDFDDDSAALTLVSGLALASTSAQAFASTRRVRYRLR